jgi:gas vesicle protein
MSNGKGGGGFFVGFFVGAIVGGAAAVLLSQDDTRDVVIGKMREAGNFAKDATEDLRGKVGDVTSQWQSSASELYERGRQVVENARATLDAAVEEGKDAAAQTRGDLENESMSSRAEARDGG